MSRGPAQFDWHWNRPIVEHLVPLSSPDVWWYGRSWACHLRCHQYRKPIPPLVLARSNVGIQAADPRDAVVSAIWPPPESGVIPI